jgi:chemotaxis protein methyltransferase CheR
MIARGADGLYSESALSPIARGLRSQWFRPEPGMEGGKVWRVGEALQTLVSFRLHNLMGSWPMRASYQAIFCRNVLIYFDQPTSAEIWGRMEPMLAPNGRLYVGHSERVVGVSNALQLESLTTYRKRPAPPAPHGSEADPCP